MTRRLAPSSRRSGESRRPWLALLLLGALLLVALLAWVVLPGPGVQDAGPVLSAAPAAERSTPLPQLEAPTPEQLMPDWQAQRLLEQDLHETDPVPTLSLAKLEPAEPERSALRLLVLAEDDRPVPDAKVQMRVGGADGPPSAAGTATTDGEGRCLLHWPGGSDVHVFAADMSGSSGLHRWRDLSRRAQTTGEAVLVLRGRSLLIVTVREPDGRPVAGAQVLLGPDGGPPWVLPREPALTDAGGQAALDVEGGLGLVLQAREPGRASEPVFMTLEPSSLSRVDLVLPGPWEALGTVSDERGQPVAGARVILWRDLSSGLGPAHRQERLSDDTGSFRFVLPTAGAYLLQARSDEHAPGEVQAALSAPGRPVARLDVRLWPAAAISGRLEDGAGLPLPGVQVHARPRHVFRPAEVANGPSEFDTLGQSDDVTAADGAFRLGGLLPGGTYIVWCRPEDAHPERKLVLPGVPAGTEHLLLAASEQNLARAVLEGRVLGPDGGALAAVQASLLVQLDGTWIDTRQPDLRLPDGVLHIEGLAPGHPYALRLDAPGCGAVQLPVFNAVPGVNRVDARLSASTTLELAVRDERGLPLPLAAVTLSCACSFPLHTLVRPLRCDAFGNLLAEFLDPGPWSVAASHAGRRLEQRIELLPGFEQRVLTLPP